MLTRLFNGGIFIFGIGLAISQLQLGGFPNPFSFTGSKAENQSKGDSTILFEGNFEKVKVSRKKIEGWEGLTKIASIQAQGFAWSGAEKFANASIKVDQNKKVLYAEVIDDDSLSSGQTRFQWSVSLQKKVEVIHVQYRMYLSPDIAELNNYPKAFKWFSIFELWNEGDPAMDGDYGSARWNLNIHKDLLGKVYWAWESEYMQPKKLMFKTFTTGKKNYKTEIPLGKWFTLDILFNRNGRTIVKIDDQTIFDFVGQNQYPGKPNLYPAYRGNAINVFKLYTSDEILDWMRARNKKIYAMYNDFKWFNN